MKTKESEPEEELETTPAEETVTEETPVPEPDGATPKGDAADEEDEFEFTDGSGKSMRLTAKEAAEKLANYDKLRTQLGREQNRRSTAERERDELRGATTKASDERRRPDADNAPLEDDDLRITEEDLGDTEKLLGKFDKLVKAVKGKGAAPVDVTAQTEAILEKRELFATDERMKRLGQAERDIILKNAIDFGIRSNAVNGTAFSTYQECVDAYYDALSGTVTPKDADESQPRFVRNLRKAQPKNLDSSGEGAADDIVSKALSLVGDQDALSAYLGKLKPEQRERVLATVRGKSKVPGMVE